MLDTVEAAKRLTRHTSLRQRLTRCMCRIEGAKAPRDSCMRSAELVRHASCWDAVGTAEGMGLERVCESKRSASGVILPTSDLSFVALAK